jgi:hypothetical protein
MSENTPVSPAPTVHRRSWTVPTWAIIVGTVGVLVLLCCAGTGIYNLVKGDPKPSTSATPTAAATPPRTTSGVPPRVSPSPDDPDPTPTAQKRPATIREGEWQAGPDFPPGRYETTTTASSCVWQVTTGQGESVHYVDPGHIGPGHYTFTFKAGETLHNSGCGTWTKTG